MELEGEDVGLVGKGLVLAAGLEAMCSAFGGREKVSPCQWKGVNWSGRRVVKGFVVLGVVCWTGNQPISLQRPGVIFAPRISAMSRAPRQMPRVGIPARMASRMKCSSGASQG